MTKIGIAGNIMKCPYCGTDNPAGEDFCSNCGGYLAGAADQTVVGSSNPTVAGGSGNVGATGSVGGVSGTSGTLVPNSTLESGRYVVEKVLGQGGMGAAVLARDIRVSNKKVVIKELVSDNTDPNQRQEDVRNFEREVETLANLDHPLIPTVTDSFQEAGRYYMVQEYAAGENLEAHMERLKQPMPEREALTYASQVLDILEYLAEQSPPIIHRDIKPANIIIGAKDKRARLVDFGIARTEVVKNSQRKQTSALGTPGYAPPEQYQGNADARSDLYALAATLHHVLTNRDPRDYPPFSYPPARSLNGQVSADSERVLERALTIDASKRYQNAAAMKHDIDEILARQFHVTGDTSSYMLKPGLTPLPSTNLPSSPNQPRPQAARNPVSKPGQVPPYSYPSAYPPPPPNRQQQGYRSQSQQGYRGAQQPGMYAPPQPLRPQQRRQSGGSNYLVTSFLLLLIVLVVIGAIIFFAPRFTQAPLPGGGSGNVSTQPLPANGIGVTMIDNEPIGISDGRFVFDTSRASSDFKKQAAEKLAAGDGAAASSLWQAALGQDSGDAEALIYLQDQQVSSSGIPYITLVVPTMLTGPDKGTGQDILQGAYVAQKTYNANGGAKLGGVEVRLLIGNAGKSSLNAARVSNQIALLVKQKDANFVGVVGWDFSSYANNAFPVLAHAKIPLISPTASSDNLTGASPYFFRVAPSNLVQAQAQALYAQQKLNVKKVALFSDSGDSYSQNLAQDFQDQFAKHGGSVGVAESYKRGDAASISNALADALKHSDIDLIYFAGYASDAGTLLTDLPNYTNFPNIPVMGGDALYELSGYPASASQGFKHLHFTSFAYPDEWEVLGYGDRKPAFFNDYIQAFNPNGNHPGGGYGYTRPNNNVILSYDAMTTVLTACKNGLNGQKSLTPEALQQALTQITGSNTLQGVSGQIAFANGDAVDKAVLILYVDNGGHIHLEGLAAGTFLVKE